MIAVAVVLPAPGNAARCGDLLSRALLARAVPRPLALPARSRAHRRGREEHRRVARRARARRRQPRGRASCERSSNTGTAASITGLVALVGLLWTASGMAASVRLALAVVWEEGQPRPYLRAKLLDLVLVFFGVGLLLAAFVANVTLQLVTSYGTEIADRLGLKRFDGAGARDARPDGDDARAHDRRPARPLTGWPRTRRRSASCSRARSSEGSASTSPSSGSRSTSA